MRSLAAAALLTSLSFTLAAQTPAPPASAPPPAFEAADVHPAPFLRTRFSSFNLSGDRLSAHQTDLLSLITFAYNIDRSTVQGGPTWLEWNRYEITAKVPQAKPAADVRLMMRALLAERFHLVVHNGTAPLPAYVLSVPPGGKPRLKASESTDPPMQFCPNRMPATTGTSAIPTMEATCTNITMEAFAAYLKNMSSDYLNKPVVDRTGLKGGWDFAYHWNFKGSLVKAGADGISIFDALDRQLGLKLELKTSSLPTLIVDGALEIPTPNSPDLAKLMPPQPPPQFDVATIKPYKPTGPLVGNQGFLGSGGGAPISQRFTRDQVDYRGVPLRWLITFAWQLDDEDPEVIVNAPKWLDTERWDILGKVVFDPAQGPQYINIDDLRLMFRTLLKDRFKLESHLDTQDYTGYTLTAVDPRLKQTADPTARTRCGDDVFPIAKDPRLAPSARNILVQCQNMTMAQFSRELSTMVGYYMHRPPLDATGLKGAYDFTINFSSANKMPWWTGPSGSPASQGPPSTEPDNALSMYDAVRTQLGLKLTKDRHPGPVLVIDHIQETPTEN